MREPERMHMCVSGCVWVRVSMHAHDAFVCAGLLPSPHLPLFRPSLMMLSTPTAFCVPAEKSGKVALRRTAAEARARRRSKEAAKDFARSAADS